MAKICFEIELDTETGEVMAGVCPPEEDDMMEDKAYLQPVASIGEAIGMAHDALMYKEPVDAEKRMANQGIRRGYDRAKGPRMMGGMEK